MRAYGRRTRHAFNTRLRWFVCACGIDFFDLPHEPALLLSLRKRYR